MRFLGGLGFPWSFFLNRGNVQAGDDDAALVVEPYHNPAALRVDGSVVGTGNPVAVPAACDDHEWLEWPSEQKLTDVAYHATQRS